MEKFLSMCLVVLVLAGCSTTENKAEVLKNKVYVNQVGYLPGEDKYFMVESYTGGFQVLDQSNSVVYSGEVIQWKIEDKPTGMDLYKGDFTDIGLTGRFTIKLDDGSESFPFDIDEKVFNKARDVSMKSYYFQRAGIELKEEYAGRFARPAGHFEKLKYHKSASVSGKKDVTGGWYDAGDYGRYIGPGSIAVGLMMLGYEQYPEKFDFDNNSIPESGNGVSDFLDEIRYELEWMLKMQYTGEGEFKGALPWMTNELDYSWGMPHESRASHYIYDFSTVATADFTAVMANAARNFKSVDEEFSNKCLDAALLAWEFLERTPAYPKGGFQNPPDTIAGGYGASAEDNITEHDDRVWAAVELYITTGNQDYHEYAKPGLNILIDEMWDTNWISVAGLSKLQYILADETIVDTKLQNRLRAKLLEYCDYLVNVSENDGFKTVLEPWGYYWGSNGLILNSAEMLIFSYELTGDKKYYNTALYQLNYILGLNALNFTHVSGLGSFYPENMHNAVTENDDTYGVYPGLITCGANKNLNDDYTLPKYFNINTPPALCYIDHVDSWSTNENCIGYNAPLVPVTAYFSN